jgi:enoyl-[acyl-carrier protein] reductase II
VSIPVIAGGGVADGWGIAALLALGADGVQLGTRFLMTDEATVHRNYKAAVQKAQAADAVMVGARSLPIRMLRNRFAQSMFDAESTHVDQSAYEEAFKASSLSDRLHWMVMSIGGRSKRANRLVWSTLYSQRRS